MGELGGFEAFVDGHVTAVMAAIIVWNVIAWSFIHWCARRGKTWVRVPGSEGPDPYVFAVGAPTFSVGARVKWSYASRPLVAMTTDQRHIRLRCRFLAVFTDVGVDRSEVVRMTFRDRLGGAEVRFETPGGRLDTVRIWTTDPPRLFSTLSEQGWPAVRLLA